MSTAAREIEGARPYPERSRTSGASRPCAARAAARSTTAGRTTIAPRRAIITALRSRTRRASRLPGRGAPPRASRVAASRSIIRPGLMRLVFSHVLAGEGAMVVERVAAWTAEGGTKQGSHHAWREPMPDTLTPGAATSTVPLRAPPIARRRRLRPARKRRKRFEESGRGRAWG